MDYRDWCAEKAWALSWSAKKGIPLQTKYKIHACGSEVSSKAQAVGMLWQRGCSEQVIEEAACKALSVTPESLRKEYSLTNP